MMKQNPRANPRSFEDRIDEHIVKRGLATKQSINSARASEGKKPLKE